MTAAGYDTVVIGGDADGLVVATALARAGSRVLVLEAAATLGGTLREIEFAPGFRAAPLAVDSGWLSPDVARGAGLAPRRAAEAGPTPSAFVPAGERTYLELSGDPAATARSLARFSARDAESWPAFSERMARLAGFLQAVYRVPPPLVDASSFGELAALFRMGRRLRGLGKAEMIELLRAVPMAAAELLDERFETEALKAGLSALAVRDLCQGPRSGGTGFSLLHRHVGGRVGVFHSRPGFPAGPAALVTALTDRARQAGVVIRTGAPVASIRVESDRVAGVGLAGGEAIAAREVVSTAGPRRTLLDLLDPVHLEVEFIDLVRNIRFRGAQSHVLLALDDLPDVPGLGRGGEALAGVLLLAPTVDYVERAYDATKYGRPSDQPVVEVRVPSLQQPSLAPPGKHVMALHVQYTPHTLRGPRWDGEREALGDRVLAVVERFLPGLAARVRHRLVLTPVDLEERFGLTEGAVTQGEMMLDQILFMRPVAGWSRYAMPVSGLFLCGPGTHPGAGIVGASGWLAAQAVLRARVPRD